MPREKAPTFTEQVSDVAISIAIGSVGGWIVKTVWSAGHEIVAIALFLAAIGFLVFINSSMSENVQKAENDAERSFYSMHGRSGIIMGIAMVVTVLLMSV